MAQPRKIEELERSAKQIADSQKEEEAKAEATKKKEMEIARDWEILRQLKPTEMVHSSKDLISGLAKLKAKLETDKATQKNKHLMDFLKKQRKFLFLAGVPSSQCPILSKKLPTGKKKDYSPQEFCELLGAVLNKFEKGKFDDVLEPIALFEEKLVQVGIFRGGTMTAQMKLFLSTEKSRIEAMHQQVSKKVKAGIVLYKSVKVHPRKSSAKPSEKLKKGVTVWVADEDDLNPEADFVVWSAKVVKKAAKGFWTLDFDGTCYNYIWYNIFFTEVDARIWKDS